MLVWCARTESRQVPRQTSTDPRDHAERFARSVAVQGDGCWLWQGPPMRFGYGRFYTSGKFWLAHRAAYVIAHGPIPGGMQVCHRCDVPACVNPAHLFLGTQAENMADRRAKGRGERCGAPTRFRRGEQHSRRRLHPEAVRAIRTRLASGEPGAAIARSLGVSKHTVRDVKTGRTWSHVQ
jgi:hypothetical protein